MAETTILDLEAVNAEILRSGKTWYVYILVRPSGEYFYVGKGKGKRIAGHEREVRGKWSKIGNTHKYRIIQKILRSGGQIGYIIDSWHDNESSALQRECELVLAIGREDLGTGPLANKSSGGESPVNGPDGCKRIAKAKREWHQQNRDRSSETQRRMVDQSFTEEWRRKQSAAQLKFIEENPEAAEDRANKVRQEARSPKGRKSRSERVKRYFERHPEAANEHSEKIKQWCKANPEHLEKMWANSKAAGALEKASQALKKWRQEDAEGVAAANEKRLATTRTESYRQAARSRLIAYINDNPIEFANRQRKRNAKAAQRTKFRFLCELIVSEHNLLITLPDRRASLATWAETYSELKPWNSDN